MVMFFPSTQPSLLHQLTQLLPERVHEYYATRSSAIIQETYAEDLYRLLRVSHIATEPENKNNQRAKRCAAEE